MPRWLFAEGPLSQGAIGRRSELTYVLARRLKIQGPNSAAEKGCPGLAPWRDKTVAFLREAHVQIRTCAFEVVAFLNATAMVFPS